MLTKTLFVIGFTALEYLMLQIIVRTERRSAGKAFRLAHRDHEMILAACGIFGLMMAVALLLPR